MTHSSVVGIETRAWFIIISRVHNFNIVAENSAPTDKHGNGGSSNRDAGHTGRLKGNDENEMTKILQH